jgi:hypothetical protein
MQAIGRAVLVFKRTTFRGAQDPGRLLEAVAAHRDA